MKTQLILLTEPILVSDERAQEGFNYDFALKQVTKLHKTYETYTTEWNFCRKIIAGIPELPSITYSDGAREVLEKKYGWVDVEKHFKTLIKDAFENSEDIDQESLSLLFDCYKQGIQVAQSLNEKKFSKEDLKKAIDMAQKLTYGDSAEFPEHQYDTDEIIQSLSQSKIIDVEVEMEEDGDCEIGGREYINYSPKIINNSIKVTKVL